MSPENQQSETAKLPLRITDPTMVVWHDTLIEGVHFQEGRLTLVLDFALYMQDFMQPDFPEQCPAELHFDGIFQIPPVLTTWMGLGAGEWDAQCLQVTWSRTGDLWEGDFQVEFEHYPSSTRHREGFRVACRKFELLLDRQGIQ